MKVGILSDSHDNLLLLKRALDILEKEKVDLILHAGDYVAPFSVELLTRYSIPWEGVLGNNDGEVLGIFRKSGGKVNSPFWEGEKNNFRIWVSHFYLPAELAFESRKYNLVVYGHTHEAVIKKEDDFFLINPGEVCGLLSGKPTLALCDLEKKVAKLIDI
ncbi:MAG TPA: metallophosphoesterase [Candidatus Atribacteria bacterium]|nr:metallophosphoesterase [Candidatus Atribacteria bacterium]